MTRTAPCDWPLFGDCPALAALPEPDADALADAATSYLWRWTGKVYGVCNVTVRPARQDCLPTTHGGVAGAPGLTGSAGRAFGWLPVLVDGAWRNLACGWCGDECSCLRPRSIRLPGPVHEVTRVVVDGGEVDAAAYRVDEGRYLIRQDGGAWPLCNDPFRPDGEGTWRVEYRWGVPVPSGGKIAAGVLACELAKAVSRDGDCQLPQRVQTLTREGVTVGLLDPFDGLTDGRTGVWLVDSWVASVTRPPQRSTVHSPDRRPARVTEQGPAW